MIDFIEGSLVEKSPAHAVIQTSGIGYFINISLHAYSQIENLEQVKLYIYEIIREDTHALYGFFEKNERHYFEMLISVNGIGANTARMILSSLKPTEIHAAIATGNTKVFQDVKGIGGKSAQRIIVDLKDKISKEPAGEDLIQLPDNSLADEALSALVMLGFPKKNAEKVVTAMLKSSPGLSLEELIKQSLKQL